MKNKKNRGFTLIELLMVISIISILSQTVLAAYSNARDKAHDANIRSSLSALRSVAINEYFDYSPNTFSPICGESPVELVLKDLGDKTGTLAVNYQCTASPSEWAAIFPLRKGGYWCSDSMGSSKQVSGFLSSSEPGSLNCDHATSTNVVIVPPTTSYACSDSVDNDNDGKIDYPNDPGCTSATDIDETNVVTTSYACSDSVDNDNDGKIDYPNDPGCTSATDTDEYNAVQNIAHPVITLIGGSTYEFWSPSANPFSGLGLGADKYVDPGYDATDAEDGDLRSKVVVTGPTLISSQGGSCKKYTYTFTYNVTDTGGFSSTPVSRTVTHNKCRK